MNYIYSALGYNKTTTKILSTEIRDKIYKHATFHDLMTLSMCSKLMKELYEPVLEQNIEAFYHEYCKYITRYSAYLLDHGLSDMWNIAKLTISVAAMILSFKRTGRLLGEISPDAPIVIKTFINFDTGKKTNYKTVEHENLPAAQVSLISGFLCVGLSVYNGYIHFSDRVSPVMTKREIGILKKIVSPSYESWIEKKINHNEFYFPLVDNHGHEFDYNKIMSLIFREKGRVNKEDIVTCPISKHEICVGELKVCKKSFDAIRSAAFRHNSQRTEEEKHDK